MTQTDAQTLHAFTIAPYWSNMDFCLNNQHKTERDTLVAGLFDRVRPPTWHFIMEVGVCHSPGEELETFKILTCT